MFQFGLIECLYLRKNLEEINMLPGLIKNAIQLYKENIARDRTIYLKFYSAYQDFSTRQQAKHFVYVGISNNNFPLIDEPTRKLYNEEEYNRILTNQLSSIFSQCQAIQNESCIKVLHRNDNFILLSKTGGRPLKDKDFSSLVNFEIPFLSLDRKIMNYKERILDELCKCLRDYPNHLCERCIQDRTKDMCLDAEEKEAMQQMKEDVAMKAPKS
jgi:hypothetical protein